MQVSVKVDDAAVRKALSAFAMLAPEAVAEALNMTANDGQRAARANLVSSLTIAPSRLTFMTRLVKIEKDTRSYSHQIRPIAISVEPPLTATGSERRRIVGMLERHEHGGVHLAPNEPFFLPTKWLRPNDTALVPRAMYPSALGLSSRRGVGGETIAGGTLGAVRSLDGNKIGKRKRKQLGIGNVGGTFIVQTPDVRRSGIYQRIGPDKKDIVLLWAFRRRITIPKRISYEGSITHAVEENWPKNAQRAINLMLRKATS